MKMVQIPKDKLQELQDAYDELESIKHEEKIKGFETEIKDLTFAVLRQTPYQQWPLCIKEVVKGVSKRYPSTSEYYLERLPKSN